MIISKKFDGVPVEDDTRILFQLEGKYGEYDTLYQKWFWDGIYAESLIFVNEDVAGLDDEQLENEVKTSSLLKEGSSVTINRTDSGYTFVNFNFETE